MSTTLLRRERRAAALCIICGKPSPQSRCPYHAGLAAKSAANRYQRERARKMAEVAAMEPAPAPPPEPPPGTNPAKCEPFKLHAVDNMQRTECARRRECMDYAMRRNWSAFTCAGCSVRQSIGRHEASGRQSMAVTEMPDLKR